jgi:SSS family solute:Na+ symporter
MIIQDIVLPIRNRPFTPEQQLRLLRIAVVGVAVFVFFFSLLFRQTSYILMFMSLTGAIYMGGAGSCIIGGLYWRRGTTAGAWGAMLVGSGLAILGFTLTQTWHLLCPWLLERYPDSAFLLRNQQRFPINGQVMLFLSALGGMLSYVVLSLLTNRTPFNLERLLHRDEANSTAAGTSWTIRGVVQKLTGIGPQFTRGDRVLALSVFGWSMLLFLAWAGASLWNLISPWETAGWSRYFSVTVIALPLLAAVIATTVMGIGGTRDVRRVFQRLRESSRDKSDDGRVVSAESAVPAESKHSAEFPPASTPSTVSVATAMD